MSDTVPVLYIVNRITKHLDARLNSTDYCQTEGRGLGKSVRGSNEARCYVIRVRRVDTNVFFLDSYD